MVKKRLPLTDSLAVQSASFSDFPELPANGVDIRKMFAVLDPFILKNTHRNFLMELEKSYKGAKTSLTFIIHTLSSAPIVHDSGFFQVMVVGGSVFKQALVRKDKDKLHILDKDEEPLPRFHTKEDLLELIEKHLRKDVSILAINFAYPLSPVFENGVLDGVLLAAMKEHSFSGLVGKRVAKEVEDYFLEK